MVAKIDFLKNDVKFCSICGTKIKSKIYDGLCSKKCLDYSLEYNSITIPIPFVKKIFLHCKDEEERFKQFKIFAERHSYDLQKVIRKATEIKNLIGGQNATNN